MRSQMKCTYAKNSQPIFLLFSPVKTSELKPEKKKTNNFVILFIIECWAFNYYHSFWVLLKSIMTNEFEKKTDTIRLIVVFSPLS